MSREDVPLLHVGTNPFIGHSYISSVEISLSESEKEAILDRCMDVGVRGAVLQTTPELVDLFSRYTFSITGVVGSAIKPTKAFMEEVTAARIVEEIQPEVDLLHQLPDVRICVHGIITDALLKAQRDDVAAELRELLGKGTGFATHFPGAHVAKIEQVGGSFCLCAFNPVGFMMKPSVEETIEALRKTRMTVVAKKILAGGWLPLERALSFLRDHAHVVDSCVVGVKSLSEVDETFGALKDVMTRRRT